MNTRFLLLLLVIGALAQRTDSAPLPPVEAQALIARLQEHRAAQPSLTADFSEERTTHLLAKPLVSQGTLLFHAPNKFRREIKGSSPSLTVSNGEKLWIYYPSFKEAELYTLGQKAFFDDSIAALTAGLNFQHVASFYHYEASREGAGYRIVLIPKSSAVKRMIRDIAVSIGDDLLIQRTEATLPKGDHVITTYRNQRAAPIAPATFDFAPPGDAHVTQPLGK